MLTSDLKALGLTHMRCYTLKACSLSTEEIDSLNTNTLKACSLWITWFTGNDQH